MSCLWAAARTIVAKALAFHLDHITVVAAAVASAAAPAGVHWAIAHVPVRVFRDDILLELRRKGQRTAATEVAARAWACGKR